MAEFIGATLLEEMRSYRRLLDAHARVPLLQSVGRESFDPAAQDALGVKLAAVTFKIALLDAVIDLFRLYDAEAIAADAHAATARTRHVAPPTGRQVDAMLRARARTLELERQIAFAHVAHLLIATDGLRHRDRELYPVEFEQLDAHFGRHYGQWAIGVVPAIAAFCRSPGLDEDIRVRSALDDFIFHLRKAAPAEQRAAAAPHVPAPDMTQLAVAGHAD
jgi:hypothetical protein